MLEEAIKLIKKQREMYVIQHNNITTYARKRDVEDKVKEKLRKEVHIRDYILEILNKQKKWGVLIGRNKKRIRSIFTR